ncbi:hypothetical protein D3C78_1780920 [compost metagenome]
MNIAHLGKQLGRFRAKSLDQHVVLGQSPFKGALDDGRLLVDFLEHEVTIRALVGRFGTFMVLNGFAFDRVAFDVPDIYFVATDFGDVAFF